MRINKDGETYEGDWGNDCANGEGIYSSPSGDIAPNLPGCRRYEGEWKNGNKSGLGRCYDANGRLIYSGYFKNDAPLAYPTQ
jgi:hypothetical protein